MSRRALSDNLGRARSTAVEATAGDGRFSASMMVRALALAVGAQPHPNPRVGAVVVDAEGSIVGEGFHRRAGEPHAEVIALAHAGTRASGATVYVTLEPCSHHGKTPPCTEALIAAGVARVVVGAIDPDERVSGQGVAKLEAAGIEVSTGLLADDVEEADPGYFHHRRTGRPLVTLKLATTLDGQIAAADRTSRWITGGEAREDTHRIRSESDVVIVGAGTVIDDDPSLDVRLEGYVGRQPRPVIVAGGRPLPERATLFTRDPLVYAPGDGVGSGQRVVLGDNSAVDLGAMMDDLGSRGYLTAMVEGGATLAAAMLRGGHVDRIVWYLAPKLGVGSGIGAFTGTFRTLAEAVPTEFESVSRLGEDIKIEAKVGS
ncbi:MAG: bifunctional diaminohydroxyphosphoribosylaminopyrimidine deaminase/5-amino-6-(5-phosphoribosylamino)uracil reductase RibD [Acidimicrobiia bacterium]|nr:bifunctional diaminohydroxyphosphoribosylaminopyrimidine deaminase/5-amino-6-(5-phosphoribosylamino)uracil reductase RibD [Acidimicrobiia bacterium]